MAKLRSYTQHIQGKSILKAWIQKRCQKCQRFLGLHSKDYCPKCQKERENKWLRKYAKKKYWKDKNG